jgi:hypothetical protein
MSWFPNWVDMYCTATGAGQWTKDALLADESIVIGTWKATPEELGEVTSRLIARAKVPDKTSEHIKALGLGLIALRDERKVAANSQTNGHSPGCDCPVCYGGEGSPKYVAAMNRLRSMIGSLAAGMTPPKRRSN